MGYSLRNEQGIHMQHSTIVNHFSELEQLRLLVIKQEIEIERLKKGYWVEGVGASKEYVTGCDKNTKSPKRSK